MLTITPGALSKLILNVAMTRPVFIWGPPGIGKSALVEAFAAEGGLECVSLLGSQPAPVQYLTLQIRLRTGARMPAWLPSGDWYPA